MIRAVLALVLAQAVTVSPPPQPVALAHPRKMHVIETMHQILPTFPVLPQAPDVCYFDGPARAVLIVQEQGGYRVIVLTRSGVRHSQFYPNETTSVETSMK